jgi:hypothetical protein
MIVPSFELHIANQTLWILSVGADRCAFCPVGKTGVSGQLGLVGADMCVPCDAGRFRAPFETSCGVCPIGRFSGGGGAQCADCLAPAVVTGQTINGEEYPASACQYFSANDAVDSTATAIQIVSNSNMFPKIGMQIMADVATGDKGSTEQTALFLALTVAISASLGLDISEVEITRAAHPSSRRRMQSTAIDIEFIIRSADSAAALAALEVQLTDENSQLRNADEFEINEAMALSYAFICPTGLHRPDGATDCSRCPGNGYPDPDDSTRCIECQTQMTVNAEGTACVCVNGYYDARAGLFVCYKVGEDWSALDFDDRPENGAKDPQCLKCGDCLICEDGSAKVVKGFMVSEADKATAAGSTSACVFRASVCSNRLLRPVPGSICLVRLAVLG